MDLNARRDLAQGRLIYVVGASGAGKDSVLDYARARIPASRPIRFVRRTITRPPTAHGEKYNSVTQVQFDTLRGNRAFALHWRANGLSYGIPVGMNKALSAGLTTVVNGSRAHLATARLLYPNIEVVHITAPYDELQRRLVNRSRECIQSVEVRLKRSDMFSLSALSLLEISNVGLIDEAGEIFLRLLLESTTTKMEL